MSQVDELIARGKALHQQGENAVAATVLQRATKLAPTSVDAWRALGQALSGWRNAEAQIAFEHANDLLRASRPPDDDVVARHNRANTLNHLGRDSTTSGDGSEQGKAKPSVLVVDDCPDIRQMLREVLEEEGYTVSTAEHGGPALAHLRASPVPLLVLLGLTMPCVDGEAVLHTVASDSALAARHRFIMVTGATPRATTGSVAALRQQLGVPVIAKPFTVDQLLDTMAEVEAGRPDVSFSAWVDG